MLVRKKRLLVYEYELANQLNEGPVILPTGIQWEQATRGNISSLFKDDPRRRNTFLRFIDEGYYGIIMYDNAQWTSYQWMTMPDTLGPPHLPLSIQQRRVCWLFYAHTRSSFRGRGLHKCGLRLRAAYALNTMDQAKIYTDTSASNIASRKGKLAEGFSPRGIIDTYEIRIPRVKSWVWGSWDVDADHPGLDGGISS